METVSVPVDITDYVFIMPAPDPTEDDAAGDEEPAPTGAVEYTVPVENVQAAVVTAQISDDGAFSYRLSCLYESAAAGLQRRIKAQIFLGKRPAEFYNESIIRKAAKAERDIHMKAI